MIPFEADNWRYLPVPTAWYYARSIGVVSRKHRLTGELQVLGSAIFVAQIVEDPNSPVGIFVTAAHVLDLDAQDREDWFASIHMPATTADGASTHFGALVKFVSVSAHASDAALLAVDLSVPGIVFDEPQAFGIDLRRPQIGDECLALGWTEDEQGQLQMSASHGTISAMYDTGLGAFRPFPGMQVECRLPSGTSGGPVIAATGGGVIGFVSSSMHMSEDEEWFGYASHIATIAELSLDLAPLGIKKRLDLTTLINSGLHVVFTEGSVTSSWERGTFKLTWGVDPAEQ